MIKFFPMIYKWKLTDMLRERKDKTLQPAWNSDVAMWKWSNYLVTRRCESHTQDGESDAPRSWTHDFLKNYSDWNSLLSGFFVM